MADNMSLALKRMKGKADAPNNPKANDDLNAALASSDSEEQSAAEGVEDAIAKSPVDKKKYGY